MKTKKMIAILFISVIVAVALAAVTVASLTGLSRLQLAERSYADSLFLFNSAQNQLLLNRCDVASIKVESHESLRLSPEELKRLADILAECSGKK